MINNLETSLYLFVSLFILHNLFETDVQKVSELFASSTRDLVPEKVNLLSHRNVLTVNLSSYWEEEPIAAQI